MELGAQMLVLAILATAEFCAEPIEGGVGEPPFCRITAIEEVSTPFFSIVVEPDFLVGVDNRGRRLQIQSSIRQNQDVLVVEKVDGLSAPNWPDCPAVTETVADSVTWRDCRVSTGVSHERRLVAVLKDGYVLIVYSYTRLGASLAPALERMTQSIRIRAI